MKKLPEQWYPYQIFMRGLRAKGTEESFADKIHIASLQRNSS